MTRTITIDPVTRIEGHAKITLHLDDQGKVSDARMHVTQFRGFEKFCEGRPLTEMPSLMARICGICPVSHLMAAAKACDALLAVEIPPTAVKLRRIMHLAQTVQSHALSFFHLSSPDMLLGFDSDPAKRNIYGVIEKHPELARDGVRLRGYGQRIIELLGHKKIHPAWVVPGGVNEPLKTAVRDEILAGMPEALAIATKTVNWFKGAMEQFKGEIETFSNFPSLFLGAVNANGELDLYDGKLRFVDAEGNIVVDQIDPNDYPKYIGEATEEFSYLKSPYFLPHGYPQGVYRVGPLARLNAAESMGSPIAEKEFVEWRQRFPGCCLSSFYFHYARLIEIIHGLEHIQMLLQSPDILDTFVRARARPNRLEGVGISEAPRGTLIHHYKIDRNGLVTWANLIIATGHNNLAINRGILQVAERFVSGSKLTEGALNRCEAVIRAFDPCLSCSSHALGQMPIQVELHSAQGEILDAIQR